MQSLPDMNELMKIAASPGGQKLIAMMRNNSKIDIAKLMQNASSGNYAAAKAELSELLASEETQQILRQLESQHE